MEMDVASLRKLIEALAAKAGRSLDRSGLIGIGDEIGDGNPAYLYKNLWLKIEGRNPDARIQIQDYKVNLMLRYLGFSSYKEFRDHADHPISAALLTLVGNYYCYIRANLPQGVVLRSPARIIRKDSSLVCELRGKESTFSGEVIERGSCLYVFLTSAGSKAFQHVYKFGSAKSPEVLQGVFCGMSSAYDPIGGRVVLVRQKEQQFDRLAVRKERVSALIASADIEESRVGTYFENYHNNNLSPFKSYEFGLNDLISPTPEYSAGV